MFSITTIVTVIIVINNQYYCRVITMITIIHNIRTMCATKLSLFVVLLLLP